MLECRDIDLNKLEGVLFDFACGLHPYVLNREAKNYEFLRFLVDGAHWNSQKKLKRPDNSGRGGHIGCSEGYNFNVYKKNIGFKINSQTREIMHSVLDKCVTSLKLKTYHDFMHWMKTFFALRNLRNMNVV